ncbi:MAG: pyridoxamine 5'-phosphate oxidase family protein [Planctomycetes bacterium]|nr:pyridoxamine 5'-phosphate oxidase family protein [Planctomycetota bacterium]
MAKLPEVVSKAWDDRQGPIVLATCDRQGNPNIIYAGCVAKYGEEKLVVADNYFNKTRANIKAGSRGAILFITKEGKAYQVKGSIEYCTNGEVFDDMKQNWLAKKYPGHAAAALVVEEVYQGANKLL